MINTMSNEDHPMQGAGATNENRQVGEVSVYLF